MLIGYSNELKELKGMYIYGSPGSGKTFLMDMFYEEVNIKKKRAHFNEFMLDVHQRLHKLKDNITYKQSDMDPLYILATEMSKEFNLLCFDEFQVTDIADAVILKRLFEILYKNYVVMVATSNRHPDKLYLQGLQRHLFLPFIAEVKNKCEIVNISAKDFRVRHDIIADKYLCPINYKENHIKIHNHSNNHSHKLSVLDKEDAKKYGINPEGHGYIFEKSRGKNYIVNDEIHKEFNKIFRILTEEKTPKTMVFEVAQNRTITCSKWSNGVGYFHFHELCEAAVGASDFIAIAQNCSTILLEGIPTFNLSTNRNSLRSFIKLIDELYNHNVMFYCTAETTLDNLFIVSKDEDEIFDEAFAFDRTKSRLNEMQSEYYFKTKQHKFYKKEDDEQLK
jgi:protein AFG1